MIPSKSSPAFEKFVREWIDKSNHFLIRHGWFDAKSGGPDVAAIAPLVTAEGWFTQGGSGEAAIKSCLTAPAHEYQGNLVAASAWYELGQYEWMNGNPFPENAVVLPQVEARRSLAIHQLPAAICADRVGNTERARELFKWAAANYILPDDELQGWARTHQLQMIWELLPMRSYALVCLEDWAEARKEAETAQFWVQKDYRAAHYRVQIQLLPILLALSRWKLEPGTENRQQARKMLGLKAITSRDFGERLLCFFYLYNLRAHFGHELLESEGTGE